jgi:3-oxoacyl-[acyl-carrier-protein] synthase I
MRVPPTGSEILPSFRRRRASQIIDDPADAIGEMAVAVLSPWADGVRLPVLLALPETRPGLGADLPRKVAASLTRRIPGLQVALSGSGHAAAGAAFRQAREYVSYNQTSCIAVVGADSYLHRDTIAWLDDHRQLHARYNAWGFIPGAAAGACLLCHPSLAQIQRRPPRAFLEAIALDQEEVPLKTEGVCLGRALSRIVESLLDGQPECVVFDAFYCDQNGESYRADEIGFMLTRASGRFRDSSAFIAPADCWGDVGATSLPLFVALAVEAADRGYAAGPVSLHLAGSESGLRAGLRLRTPMRVDWHARHHPRQRLLELRRPQGVDGRDEVDAARCLEKTPSPGGPVPVPYPVIVSLSSQLVKGTTTVKVDGGNMAAVKGSEFSMCNGDEAGTAGGVKSSTFMKEATWIHCKRVADHLLPLVI